MRQDLVVKKRQGQIVKFDESKIKNAVQKCLDACGESVENIPFLYTTILNNISSYRTLLDGFEEKYIDVETVQDIVENVLIASNLPQAAKSYILYRKKREELRNVRLPGLPKQVIADFIHVAKYSQYKKEVFRREVHGESISRVEDMHIRKYPQIEPEIRRVFNKVRERVTLPSMRSMQFGGKGVEAINERIYNCSFSPCNRIEFFSQAFFLLLCGCGTGFSVQKHHVAQLPPLKSINQNKVKHHVVEDTIQGWADALHALIMSYVEGDQYVEFNYYKIRNKGSLLSTSGGRAPGHFPLKLALKRIRKLLDLAQGRHLKPIECHDLICLMSEAVLAGGVRRSASLSLFSVDDEEMITAKTGEWWKTHPWRARANNSAVLVRGEVTFEQFDRLFRSTKEFGEPGFFFTDSREYGGNPCFHPDTRISTNDGWIRIEDMAKAGLPIPVNTDLRAGKGDLLNPDAKGSKLRNATSAFLTKKSAEVYEILTEHGHRLKVTENHKFPTFNGRKETHELRVGDNLLLNSGMGEFGKEGNWDQGFELGIHAKNNLKEAVVPENVWRGTSQMIQGYICGIFSPYGKLRESSSILSSSNDFLQDIQTLLSSFTIISKIVGDTLIVTDNSLNNFVNLVSKIDYSHIPHEKEGFSTSITSITKMDELTDVYCLTQPETNTVIANGIVSGQCVEISFHPFYTVDLYGQNYLKERGVHVELGQVLTGWSFCNLTEVNVAACKTVEEFMEAVEAATVIGTLQAGYTHFPYLGPVTELLAHRDSLLGVSMTGMVDNPVLAFDADLQKRAALYCKEVNEKYSALIGINSAARLTAVKPSGTASLALGCVGSGIHPHHAKRYFRRVRMSPGEAVFQYFKSINPHMCEKVNDTEDVITFCVEAPEGALTRNEQTALEFLERVFLTQTNWIHYGTARDVGNPGLKNNVSNTVVVKPHEWEDVKHFLWDRRDRFSGISMLAYSGDKDYAFAPREEVTTEKDEFLWNNIVSNYKPVDYQFMLEMEDGTSFQGEAACSAGGCEA